MNNINHVGINTGARTEKTRRWTNRSINLNREDPAKVDAPPLDTAHISSPKSQQAAESKTGKADLVTRDQFAQNENCVATDENSDLMENLSPSPDNVEDRREPPGVLMFNQDGKPVDGVKSAGSIPPGDMLQTGEHRTARIGTFNIEWLGGCPYENPRGHIPKRTDADYKKVADVIKDSGAALLGIQEVVTEEALLKVLKNLPDWGFILSKNKNQKVGLIFDKKRVKYDLNSIRHLDEISDPKIFKYNNLRPPLSVYMKVDNFDCNFVVVHNKSGFNLKSLGIRQKQGQMLNKWIKGYLDENKDKDLMIMGDFNDFVGSETLDKIKDGILSYTTEEFKASQYSNIPHKGTIDHVGFTNVRGGAFEEVIPGTAKTINEKKYPGYTQSISDHKPVTVDVNTEIDRD